MKIFKYFDMNENGDTAEAVSVGKYIAINVCMKKQQISNQ